MSEKPGATPASSDHPERRLHDAEHDWHRLRNLTLLEQLENCGADLRSSIEQARACAMSCGQQTVGLAALLLGVLRGAPESLAAQVLADCGFSEPALRRAEAQRPESEAVSIVEWDWLDPSIQVDESQFQPQRPESGELVFRPLDLLQMLCASEAMTEFLKRHGPGSMSAEDLKTRLRDRSGVKG